MFSFSELADIVGDRTSRRVNEIQIRRFCIDSRKITSGDCFIAIKGEHFDANRFAEEALSKGASAAVLDNPETARKLREKKHNIILAENSTAALGKIASAWRDRINAKVIAVTGSAGKTTTREMLKTILSQYRKTSGAEKSFNNQIGLPISILNAEKDDEFLVLEAGTNAVGEIEKLSRIARPDIAIITCVLPAHIEGFGSLENIAREKASIIEGLKPNGMLICKSQKELIDALRGDAANIQFFSLNNPLVGRENDIESFEINYKGSKITISGTQFQIPLPGKGNLENFIAARLAAVRCGLSDEQIKKAAGKLKTEGGRLEIIHCRQSSVINDCYNSNPGSLANAAEVLAAQRQAVKIAVAGDMKELGESSEQLHIQAGRKLRDSGADKLFAFGDFAECMLEGFGADAGMAFEDYDALERSLLEELRGNEALLIKGSRSMRLERLIEPVISRIENINSYSKG
ncbi:UDP-N-acetylmuramoyl-tripeptide--D-alanyl-D- alanine ligase [Sedimentisphaera salicampi]|uniref:UDP-N-acetylmuramoyl-tripeptide--D-alanyl-D-alanine ligase n=2 Tax=Sedimentisphaera salicampi TaxID=1941349 RepID=A0A1W6LNH6_9BACT|nr:UDP-N-acetylmuramoyl-tripeptide--D-alanyl-D-alanine ligase [Sedimentisphaera salicampi]ARN57329.1 UDP-N-acetylmuramoyl-tripeptide--D-alanyl-D- alanine ligase [Sedimentisphaera salicampi]OXU14642.1 UDP-N-acetylmuramoyl-tripeptide--D-alanyl-D-alanine ligase [Sedimentisphaera salicampi]